MERVKKTGLFLQKHKLSLFSKKTDDDSDRIETICKKSIGQ